MKPNLLEYPATREGAENIVQAMFSSLVNLWKTGRELHKTDDLVAIIHMNQDRIQIEPRLTVYATLKKHHPGHGKVINQIRNAVPSRGGTVTIWGLISFASGEACVLPIVLARN